MSYSEILVYFYSARRVGFYFDMIQIAIGEQGHVEGSTVHNQNKNNSFSDRSRRQFPAGHLRPQHRSTHVHRP